MVKKGGRKVKNRNKSTIRNSRSFAASEVNANSINHTFLPDNTVARVSTDGWWEDISIPGYASKRHLLHKLQQDGIHDDTRIITSPFMNWWSHVGSRNLPDHLPREHKISVSPTLPDVPATPEIQHVERRIHQERFDNMWDEKTEDFSSSSGSIKNSHGPVLRKRKHSLLSFATEKALERELHNSDSGDLSNEHSLHNTSEDCTKKIGKQKGSKSIRRRKENYQKRALLNNIKQFELPDQNGSYESNTERGSEAVKTGKIQLSKLMSNENNSISYPSITDTFDNCLPERAQKTGRFYNAFQDGTVSITNEDLYLSKNSNKIPSDLSGVTDIKERLSLSSSNTQERTRARKQRKLLHGSWTGQIDLDNSDVQRRRNIISLLEMTNPSIKNEFETKEPPKTGLKYLQAFREVSNEDKLSEVSCKETGNEDESILQSKLNQKPKSRQQEQILNIEDKNKIPAEKLLTQLSHSGHTFLTDVSSLSDGSDRVLALHHPTSFRLSSSLQTTRDASAVNVPTISKVKSKILENLYQATSISDSFSDESTTGTEKELVQSRASRNVKRGLIADKLLAFSDISENSQEIENENLLEEVEVSLKNSRRDSSAIANVQADMKTKFTKSLTMTDLLTKQSTALQLQEGNKSFLDASQSSGSKNLRKLQHSKNYETEFPNLQLGTSVLRRVTENSNGSSILETRKKAEHRVLEPNKKDLVRKDLSVSEKESVQEKSKGSKLHIVTDSPSTQSSKLQQSHRDLSRHDISKEISSNMQHDQEITREDVSKSKTKVNNQSRVFPETDKEKLVRFESRIHSDQEASKSLMGTHQMSELRNQSLSSQHSKNDNDASKFFTDQSSHQNDEENVNYSSVSATRKQREHGVLKNSRRNLSASEKMSAQLKSKALELFIVADSPSKQSSKQLSHEGLSMHSISKEMSPNVQYERERTHEDVSKSESKVNNQSRVFPETDKKKQVHFESNKHSDQEAGKSLMGTDQIPKRRSQRLSSQHSKNDNDASKFLTDQSSLQKDKGSVDDSSVSATRKQVEHEVPKNSRRDLSASAKVSAQLISKDLGLLIVADSPSKQSTIQLRHRLSSQQSKNNTASKLFPDQSSHWNDEEIVNDSSFSASRKQVEHGVPKNSRRDLSASEKVNVQLKSKDLGLLIVADSPSEQSIKELSHQGLSKHSISKEISSNVQHERKITHEDISKSESKVNNQSRGTEELKGLSVSEMMNAEETMKHSVSHVISSTDRHLSTLQRCLQELSRSIITEKASANVSSERGITHEGNVSKLTNHSVCSEIVEKEQGSVGSNIHSENREKSTSVLKIVNEMNVIESPLIIQGFKRRIKKHGIADHSQSVPASSITQPGMKLVPSQKRDSRVKMNNPSTINMSLSSTGSVKSSENISDNKSEPQRLHGGPQMDSGFRTHTSTSNKDKYQNKANDESVIGTKSSGARLTTKSLSSLPQSKVIAPDSKRESMKDNGRAIEAKVFIGKKYHTLFLEESRPKEDERDILSTTIVENNLGIMSQKLSAVKSLHRRQQMKLTLLQYRKACKQIQTHPANYAQLKKLLAHREKMEDIFNISDLHSSKNNNVSNIRSQKKDIEEKKAKKRTEKVASIFEYVKSTKSPFRISWQNAVDHPKVTAAVNKTKTSVNRKLNTSDRDVVIIRNMNKAPGMKRPTWLHTGLYKSLSKTVIKKIKDKNVINPQKESQEIISKLVSLIDLALRYRRKGCNPFVDEVIKHLYRSAIIKTPMNFICFCMRYLPETFIDKALRVKENDSGILGNVIDRDLNL